MTTATQEIPTEWTKVTGALPPLVILEIGDKIEGKITAVDNIIQTMKEKVKGKWVEKEKERTFYRIELTQPAKVHGGKKGEKGYAEMEFASGQVVSVPEAGALDNSLAKIARAVEGKGDDQDADMQKLVGLQIRIMRLPDDKMKKGQFAGNTVKMYDVDYRRG